MNKKTLTLLVIIVLGLLFYWWNLSAQVASSRSEQSELSQEQVKKESDGSAEKAFNHVIENVRYSRYWYSTPDIGDGYVEGKQIPVLIFWTKADRQSKVGICSSRLARCLATSGETIEPEMEQMPIDGSLTAKAAFESFIEDGIDVGGRKLMEAISQAQREQQLKAPPTSTPNSSVPTIPSTVTIGSFSVKKRLSLADLEFVEKTVTLPPLGLPTVISRREIPKEAAGEAKKIKQTYSCWYEGKRPRGCTGTLRFAYYHESNSTWPVLRTCSSTCMPMFQGDSIQFLRRGSDGWEAYGGGQVNSPKDEVARLKQKIEQAEMFRFQIP